METSSHVPLLDATTARRITPSARSVQLEKSLMVTLVSTNQLAMLVPELDGIQILKNTKSAATKTV